MAHFIVTFRIKNDATYQARYDSFVNTASSFADIIPWDETTSFLAFKAKDHTLSSAGLCSALYLQSEFDAVKDMMVVIDLDNRTKATRGDIAYPGLLAAGLGF
ncbi:hypothetical protein [Bordetella sp. 15P40C-2]|uniref:hypothetical protein n=1 Tax=Bordetella sp. 15P40C-2 TaxID=2572246 RepID=UPI00132C62D6|nr:hypothetical protein [Bordetella sp. 15P40C-2]MVW72164.1 hypothetical protein [Bordetella sp. 15P40C-2]